MSRFNRSNLNHIKQICNEKAGFDLPEAKAPNNFKVIGVILAVLMVLTPLTVYGASYTLSALEYRDSVKKLGVEVDTFVSDFVGSIYGDSDVYVVSDGSDTSLHELIRMSVIGFKEALDPNDWTAPQ